GTISLQRTGAGLLLDVDLSRDLPIAPVGIGCLAVDQQPDPLRLQGGVYASHLHGRAALLMHLKSALIDSDPRQRTRGVFGFRKSGEELAVLVEAKRDGRPVEA